MMPMPDHSLKISRIPSSSSSVSKGLENVILAPHIASASVKATRKLRESAAGVVACAVRGEPLPNIVNGVKA